MARIGSGKFSLSGGYWNSVSDTAKASLYYVPTIMFKMHFCIVLLFAKNFNSIFKKIDLVSSIDTELASQKLAFVGKKYAIIVKIS